MRRKSTNVKCVVAFGSDVGDCSLGFWMKHDSMLDHSILRYHTEYITASNMATNLRDRMMKKVRVRMDGTDSNTLVGSEIP